jgi:lipoate-protein ligase B
MPCTAAPLFIFDTHVAANECLVLQYERIQYSRALDLQMKICESKKRGFSRDVLLLLEHPPTITLGRSGSMNHLLINQAELEAKGIDFWSVDRGGDITYHGPGQLVGYPLLTLKAGERDVHNYMRKLEESLIRLLALYGIEGLRENKLTGVWTRDGKIGAMGVHISRWITRHGFALNVNTDLTYFNLIVPCGISGRGVTSMEKLLSRPVEMNEVVDHYIQEFGFVFDRQMIRVNEQELYRELDLNSEESVISASASAEGNM